MLRRLRQFRGLRDVRVFVHLILVWSLIPILLRFPLERVLRMLTPGRSPSGAVSMARVLLFANFWFNRRFVASGTMCLRRSLVLYTVLNRYSLPVMFYLGIKKPDTEALVGHSWLESADGCVGNGCDLSPFIVMFTHAPPYFQSNKMVSEYPDALRGAATKEMSS